MRPTVPLKRLVDPGRPITYGIVQAGEDVVGGVPYIRPVDMNGQRGVNPSSLRTTSPEIAAAYTRSALSPGDVVVSIGPSFGKTMIVPDELDGANLTQGTARVAVRVGVHARYIVWALQAQTSVDFWETSIGGATFRALNLGPLAETPVPLPFYEQQRAIAAYLDRETALIDTLIEEQQHLIHMLRARQRAVVERAVFNGLEAAPTQNNAESWLPSTPCHWPVVQLGFVSDTSAGYAFPSNGFSAASDHTRLLRGVNVKPGRIDWAETVYWDLESEPIPKEYALRAGDIVFGMDRPFVGAGARVAAISGDDLPALLLQRVLRIRPSDMAARGYMRYLISTDAFLNYLEPLFTGVSVPHVSEWQVRKFKMPFPPVNEQRDISGYLEAELARIETLIAETERFMELARERRAAVITAAVTGQIDVREVT